MNLLELTTAIVRIIADDAFTDIDIKNYLNEAQLVVAGGVQSTLGSWLTPPLPELLTIDTITTELSLSHIAMPDDFHRQLSFVASSAGNEINIAESFSSFVETYPLLNQSGTVNECCEFGNNFYYQGIPTSAETLTIHYYRKPKDMSNNTDTPDGIPVHLHRGLLVNHVCWKIYELIEDGIEGPGVNTEKHMKLFYDAVRTLELFVPYENKNFMLS